MLCRVSSPVLGSSSSFEDLGTETESLPSEGIKDNPAGPLVSNYPRWQSGQSLQTHLLTCLGIA